MSEVRFYHLQKWPLERALPQLLAKVLERGHRAVLLAGSDDRVEALNALLWTYEQRSWLPHGSAQDGAPEEQPIYLAVERCNPNNADVLVLVDGVTVNDPDDFALVLDMFDGRDEAALAAARARWREHQAAGRQLTYWQQTEAGGWEQKA